MTSNDARKLRALAGIRLSSMTDVTTSPERQRETLDKLAAYKDLDIVGYADDLDISATKLPPLERPKLGKWMQERHDEFDVMIFWKLDRIVRGPADLTDMIRWCRKHGKNLIFAEDSFDLSTPFGEGMAYMAAVFAGMESTRIRERVIGAQSFLRGTNRRVSAMPPYGYTSAPDPDSGGRVLVQDETADTLRWIIDRAVEGWSLGSIAADLNERGIPSNHDRWRISQGKDPKGQRWHDTVLGHMLRSQTLLGYRMHKGRPVLGADHSPMVVAEPIITRARWKELQTALNGRKVRRERTHGGSPLLGVLYCANCHERPLYRSVATHKLANGEAKDYVSYRCKAKSCRGSINETTVLDYADDMFRQDVGPLERMSRRFIPGSDHTAELEEVRDRIADLRDARYVRGEFTSRDDVEVYDRIMSGLLADRDRLEAIPHQPSGWVLEPTGETYADVWERTEDWHERGQLMREANLRLELTTANGYLEGRLFAMDTEESVRKAEGRRAG